LNSIANLKNFKKQDFCKNYQQNFKNLKILETQLINSSKLLNTNNWSDYKAYNKIEKVTITDLVMSISYIHKIY